MEAEPRKVFWVVGCPLYRKVGIPTHMDYETMAVMALRAAELNGCEDIVIEVKGMRPRRFTVDEVRELVRRNPTHWLPLYYRSPAMFMSQAGLI